MVQQLERAAERLPAEDLRPIVSEEPEVTVEAKLTSYYDYPSVKNPEWKWQIPTYFFTGGVAAGSYLVATLAGLFGTRGDRQVVRMGHLIALLFTVVSPILLIVDLGRPRRFMHMLRVFKTRSPMNLGTWGLSTFGLFAGISVLRLAVEEGLFGRDSLVAKLLAWAPLRVYGLIGSLFAFFVGSYTGLLLSFTNVPVWAKNSLLQGPLFAGSAMSTGLAAISLSLSATHSGSKHSEEWLSRAENMASVGEMALTAGSLASMGTLSSPLVGRPYGPHFWLGAVGLGMIAPVILRRQATSLSGESRRHLKMLASLSTLVGGLIFRWVEVQAGQHQAETAPKAYFRYADGR